MKRICLWLFVATLFASCSTDANKYFGVAVLNSNILYGFADDALQEQFAQPSSKLVDEKTGATAIMKRAEVLEMKINAVEDAYTKVKGLTVTDETKEMLRISRTMYEFVLPVLKNEYKQLAELYDNNAPEEKIKRLEQWIRSKYAGRFEELRDSVLQMGKLYAEENNIQVIEVNPAPPRL